MMTLPVDAEQLLNLFKWIVKGLVWHHWRVRLTDAHDITAVTLTKAGEELFDRQFNLNAAASVERTFGNGTFWYQGAQGVDLPEVTIWRLALYAGIHFGDPTVPGEVATRVGVMTGPRSIRDTADRMVRFSP